MYSIFIQSSQLMVLCYTIFNMQTIIDVLQTWIQHAGAWGVFGAPMVEEVISLIPSSIVQTGAGAFLLSGSPFDIIHIIKLIFSVSIPAALGVTLGSLPYVWIARKYGISMIDRWGKWVGVSLADLRKLETKLSQTAWDDVLFVGMRAFPVIPSVALAVYGGIIEMSWWRYSILSFIGVFIRATGLGIVGWLLGNAAGKLGDTFGSFEKIGLIIVVIIFGAYLFWYKKKNTLPN